MNVVFNTIGLMGTVSFLVAYYLLQRNTFTGQDPRYLWMNFGGAVAVLISLFWSWNLPAFLLEVAWGIVSAYGLFKLRQSKI